MGSLAEETFIALRDGGEAWLREMLAAPRAEHELVDFKRAENLDRGNLSRRDQRMLAVALSGFANGMGGVLILGVNYKEGSEPSVPGVADPDRYEQCIQALVSRLTEPPLAGVDVAKLRFDDGAAVLAVHVPQRAYDPVRTNCKDLHTYFWRVGESFVPMPHALLAAAFGRPPHPNVVARFGVASSDAIISSTANEIEAAADLIVSNRGLGLASHVYAVVSFWRRPGPGTTLRVQGSGSGGVSLYETGTDTTITVNGDLPVPPTGSRTLAHLRLFLQPPFTQDLVLRVSAGAGHGPPTMATLSASQERVQAVWNRSRGLNAAAGVYWIDLFSAREL